MSQVGPGMIVLLQAAGDLQVDQEARSQVAAVLTIQGLLIFIGCLKKSFDILILIML